MSSRLGNWKQEKAKVKVVFRLQFQATHVPQSGWDKLFVSFIPGDSVKATAKTTKALVRNGICKWGDPIYETTRLLQDTRTKEYDEKLYKIVVAMGTSKSSILGEATINLAEYVDAFKPFAVVLPLQGCDSGAVLHVTVQLLTSKTGFREFEQQRELRESGPSSTPDESSHCRASPSDETFSHVDSDTALGFDVSSNTSESLSAEKHDISNTNEIDSLQNTVSRDVGELAQSLQSEKDGLKWHPGRGSDYSGTHSDLSNAVEENIKLKGLVEGMESYINEMKIEVSSLQSHADDIGSKAREFSRILISEISSGDQLVREVSVLKSECSKLKEDMERLRNDKTHVAMHTDIYQQELDPLEYLGTAASCEPDSAESVNAMRDKILELARGLDESKAERDSLTKKMDEMECYYESLVQELEETQRQLLVEIQNLRSENSACLYRISGAKAEMDSLRQDMNEQTVRFSEEKKALDSLNEDLDKRAVAAEAALKRARLNYSIAVNHLQKDLEMLSFQVVSMYETNENLIKQAFPSTDGSKPEKQDTRDETLARFQDGEKWMKGRRSKEDIVLDDLKRSLHVQEGLYRKLEEELYEMHSRNLYLEVFSKILREFLLEASVDVKDRERENG